MEEESVSISVRPEIVYLAKLIVIISGQSTENTIPDMEFGMTQFGMTQCACLSVCIRIYSNDKQKAHHTEHE